MRTLEQIDSGVRQALQEPVAVFGYGVSGQAVLALFEKLGIAAVVYDEREGEGIARHFSSAEASKHGVVIYSPGFPGTHPWFDTARKEGCLLLGEMELAALFWEGDIVAITGTNGKTTLTEFLVYAFKRLGKDAVAAGNVGLPLSRVAANPQFEGLTAFCEISSFQAESLQRFTADALLWTNFSENHLDRYPDLEAYFRAKWKLLNLLRKNIFICDTTVADYARRFGLSLPSFTEVIRPESFARWVMPPSSAFSTPHQNSNLCLARRYWELLGLPPAALRSAAESFSPREHRLRQIAQIGGVAFWNDSKSTNFASALGALSSFSQPVLWIGGGQDRGGDLQRFVERLAPFVKNAFLIGETAPDLARLFNSRAIPATVFNSLAEAFASAVSASRNGDAIVFSPGFSSLDIFTNYIERGARFENLVASLKSSSSTPKESV